LVVIIDFIYDFSQCILHFISSFLATHSPLCVDYVATAVRYGHPIANLCSVKYNGTTGRMLDFFN